VNQVRRKFCKKKDL